MMTWTPCSPLETVDGLVWVKRMAQKARYCVEHESSQRELMNGYLFGESDFIDGKVLKFLRATAQAFLDAVRGEPDDAAAAHRIVAASGRTSDECFQFSVKLSKQMSNFALIEADEGRLRPGMRTSLIRFFYNRMMMPIVYRVFRSAERRRNK